MFAAIALVTFSGVSFANSCKDAQIKTIKSLVTLTEEEDLIVVGEYCALQAADRLDAVDPTNILTPVQAHDLYQFWYNECERGLSTGTGTGN